MKWLLGAFLVAIGTLALVVLIGYLLPRDHLATRIGRYRQSPEAIWTAITDVDAMPGWREGLKAKEAARPQRIARAC
jgi:hypothetical protein